MKSRSGAFLYGLRFEGGLRVLTMHSVQLFVGFSLGHIPLVATDILMAYQRVDVHHHYIPPFYADGERLRASSPDELALLTGRV